MKPIPDRLIPISSETRAYWSYKQLAKNKVLKSVKFSSGNSEYEYLGEDKMLRELKEHLSIYVFQCKI